MVKKEGAEFRQALKLAVQSIRKAMGWSAPRMARELGCTQQGYQNMERTGNLTMPVLERMRRLTGFDALFLATNYYSDIECYHPEVRKAVRHYVKILHEHMQLRERASQMKGLT